MSQGWENHVPAPMEFFRGRLFDLFHEYRIQKGDNEEKTLTLNGIEFNQMMTKAVTQTYQAYEGIVDSKPIHINKLIHKK